jgi:2-keto-4-pentenoate hydratase
MTGENMVPSAESQPQNPLSGSEVDRLYQAAEILLKARREVDPILDLPTELRPNTQEEAYALQDIIAATLGPIGGWKVGAPAPDVAPLYGPMPLMGGFAVTGQKLSRHMRRYRGVEAEIAFLLGSDLPPRATPYTREEVIAAIASAHPAIELLEPAYTDPDNVDRLSVIGDLQMHGGFAYGPAYQNWQTLDLNQESVTVAIDGSIRFEGTATNTAGTDLLRLVTYLANEASTRTKGMKAGQWITTGSWSGKTLADEGSSVLVTFENFGNVALSFE